MNNKPTSKERDHITRIKEMNCGVCNASAPSDAHHIVQHEQYLCIPLCKDCHTGYNGIHGTKAMFNIYKLNELKVLNETIRKLVNG